MMTRALLLLLLLPASLALAACDRAAEPRFFAFDNFWAASGADLVNPVAATEAQRQYDASVRESWSRILSRLEDQIDSLDRARRWCAPGTAPNASAAAPAPTAPQDQLDPEQFRQLQTRIETTSDQLYTDIAQLDPTGSRSALFLPARRLNRTIRTVLLSTLEISCGTRAVFDARLRSARRQLHQMHTYLDQP